MRHLHLNQKAITVVLRKANRLCSGALTEPKYNLLRKEISGPHSSYFHRYFGGFKRARDLSEIPSPRFDRAIFSKKKIIDKVRHAEQVCSFPLTATKYKTVREQIGGPSLATIAKKFDSFASLMKLAKIKILKQGHCRHCGKMIRLPMTPGGGIYPKKYCSNWCSHVQYRKEKGRDLEGEKIRSVQRGVTRSRDDIARGENNFAIAVLAENDFQRLRSEFIVTNNRKTRAIHEVPDYVDKFLGRVNCSGSSLHRVKKKYWCWKFHFHKNGMSDHYYCVGFDRSGRKPSIRLLLPYSEIAEIKGTQVFLGKEYPGVLVSPEQLKIANPIIDNSCPSSRLRREN